MFKTTIAALIFIFTSTPVFAGDKSPYAGQEMRQIKALSERQIEGYLKGKGMGFAKAAELNHYPGPRHVLNLALELNLSTEQQDRALEIFSRMKEKASSLGSRLVEKEKILDSLFANGKINQTILESTVKEIASTWGEIRISHLKAHVEMQAILTPPQIKKYDELRGYGDSSKGTVHHPMH